MKFALIATLAFVAGCTSLPPDPLQPASYVDEKGPLDTLIGTPTQSEKAVTLWMVNMSFHNGGTETIRHLDVSNFGVAYASRTTGSAANGRKGDPLDVLPSPRLYDAPDPFLPGAWFNATVPLNLTPWPGPGYVYKPGDAVRYDGAVTYEAGGYRYHYDYLSPCWANLSVVQMTGFGCGLEYSSMGRTNLTTGQKEGTTEIWHTLDPQADPNLNVGPHVNRI